MLPGAKKIFPGSMFTKMAGFQNLAGFKYLMGKSFLLISISWLNLLAEANI
jgi:hypothetical protein